MIRTLLTAVVGGAAGYAATRAKGPAEGLIQPRAEKVWPPTPEQRLIPGADQAHHGELMPPTIVVKKVLAALGRPIPTDRDGIEKYAAPVHFGTGIGAGAVYALLRRRVPAVGAGLGAPAGVGLYALTHGSALPALGIQPAPWKMPASSVTWEAGSHVVFGVVLELCLKVADGVERLVVR